MNLSSSLLAVLVMLCSASAGQAQLYGKKPDYKKPALYLKAGPQSGITMSAAELRAEIGVGTAAAYGELVGKVSSWMSGFNSTAEGGRLIGKTTADGLLKARALSGCHDTALLFSSVMRKLGHPALMADTAGLEWARTHEEGGGFSGHVLAEVYLDGKWMLVDPASCRYIRDYDPENPVIPLVVGAETGGLYAMFKGVDPKTYGINSNAELTARMVAFAAQLPKLKLAVPDYKVGNCGRGPNASLEVREKDTMAECRQHPCLKHPCKGKVVQAGNWDLLVEQHDGTYYAHHYPYGMIFNVAEGKVLDFKDLKAVNDYIAGLEK
ncbi:MAG TPA: transglutaminase-like domain-containing protein [Elusimicrobiales bacterium]|nr:transglutaminase-like domain-containing protein [Elusimicrobiales bacterium]